ncbi:MAG: acyloxyacyl hydrolase [Alphaproteobacteria bacterium]|nr:acyloxyacyl hydrolase [Alphaproteobacteria bacterium]
MKSKRASAPVWAFAAAVALGCGLAWPAAAQISLGPVTIGSPGDPPRFALGAGAFDVLPSTHRDSATAGELRGEYRLPTVAWIISPFVGSSGTSRGAFYGYGGFGIDVNFTPNWVLTPNVAGGYFARGGGTNLGSWWEFRSGAELDYRLPNAMRVGVAFQHMSNAGLTQRNPGEESATLVLSVPVP